MDGGLDFKEVMYHIFEAVCSIALLSLVLWKFKGQCIPSTE